MPASKGKRYSAAEVQAMHAWYMDRDERTLRDVAKRYGIANHTSVSRQFKRHGLTVAPQGRPKGLLGLHEDAKDDPYPATLVLVGQVLSWAYNADAIGGREPDILAGIAGVIRQYLHQADPASVGFIPQLRSH